MISFKTQTGQLNTFLYWGVTVFNHPTINWFSIIIDISNPNIVLISIRYKSPNNNSPYYYYYSTHFPLAKLNNEKIKHIIQTANKEYQQKVNNK